MAMGIRRGGVWSFVRLDTTLSREVSYSHAVVELIDRWRGLIDERVHVLQVLLFGAKSHTARQVLNHFGHQNQTTSHQWRYEI